MRVSGQPIAFSLWLFLLVALPWLFWFIARVRRIPADHRARLRREIPLAALGGACSLASYTLALWAMTRAPVAAVAAVRETSIVFGMLLGALVLHERVSRVRAVAAVAIAFGVWVIRAH